MKALVLFSGGLDSMLAVKLLTLQGIEVVAIHINIGFNSKKNEDETLQRRAALAGGTLKIIDVRNEYLRDILFNPRYGYGKQFNPCIDCHGFMFKVAKALMPEFGASFIATGEVVGQRPMSQKKDSLKLVKRLADDLEDDLILRPLCALVMEETTPEKEGWVDRRKLFGINGRGREVQLGLAKEFGWEDYPSPAGGCLLTDVQFSLRMKDFLAHDTFELEDIEILKNGRHFRLKDGAKLVVGRDLRENDLIEAIKSKRYVHLDIKEDMNAPSSLLSMNASKEDIKEACKIVLSFTKAVPEQRYKVAILDEILHSSPYASKDEAKRYLI